MRSIAIARRALVACTVVGTCAGLAMPALAASSASAAVAKRPAVAPGSQYVALGSSFAAGPGIAPILDTGCGRSGNNYPHLVAARLNLNLIDVTCSGATIDNILSVQQTAGGTKRPLQIDAVDGNTALVTVTVGGNDANYALNMFRTSCATDPGPLNALTSLPGAVKGALCGPVDQIASHKAMLGVEDKLTTMVNQIKAKAPKARVALVDYQTVLPANGATCANTPLNPEQIAYFNRFAKSLSLATRRAAEKTGAILIPLSKASAAHDICSGDTWSTAWEFAPDMLAGGKLAYHPNGAGMAGAAKVIIDGLARP